MKELQNFEYAEIDITTIYGGGGIYIEYEDLPGNPTA